MPKHIVLISPHNEMVDCVNLNKLNCTIIDNPKNIHKYNNNRHNLFLFDYNDDKLLFNIIDSINKSVFIDAIVTLTEFALEACSKACEYLNLNSTPYKTVNLIKNKIVMRKYLANYRDYFINFMEPKNIEEIKLFAKNNGYPFILKPKDGVGSKGVQKINNEIELNNIKFENNLLAEEYLTGDEYSVECFSFNGKHEIIGITKKIILDNAEGNNFTEVGHVIPANINEKLDIKIKNYIKKFLDIIGIHNGPSHTEIKVKKEDIKIIETHNRIGGDRISSLIKLVSDIDLVELSILWALNMCTPIYSPFTYKQAASIRFFTPKQGYISSIDGYDSIKFKPNIITIEITKKPGDFINDIKNSFNRCGFVIATGKTSSLALQNAELAIEKISFNYITSSPD